MGRSKRTGIAVAGTVLVDRINAIHAYPDCGQLTKIRSIQNAVGGCVPNVAIDLKKICPTLDVQAIGKIGADENGAYIQRILANNGVNISSLVVTQEERTSFTEVMSIIGGQRTFFVYAGADGQLTAEDIDFETLDVKLMHLGYFLLLQKIDEGEGLKILKSATENGILTSIDLVSENSDRYGLVIPCLPYVDYLIINEIEAGKLTGMDPVPQNLKSVARKLKEMGVRRKVIIHMPECSVCCSESGVTIRGTLDIPESFILGSTGAGDAFCAGALYGIYTGRSDTEILDFAASAAAISLGNADATSGMCGEEEIIRRCERFERRNICL